MPSVSKNWLIPGQAVVPTLVTKLPRGRSVNLGAITAAGDVVSFTISEPTNTNQGALVIQTAGGTTPVCVLEASLDGGVTWFTFPVVATTFVFFPFAITGQPGADTAATFAATYNVAGFGSGALFKFGRTDAGGGAANVWALVG